MDDVQPLLDALEEYIRERERARSPGAQGALAAERACFLAYRVGEALEAYLDDRDDYRNRRGRYAP